ncbi:MAG TPA: M48 family metallopeptidase [Terriglobales bacterium]|nr:M48 family metallopeptidase [Terriglobales bacterium]
MARRSLLSRTLAVTLALSFLVAQSVAQSEPVLPDPGNPGISRDEQIQVGRKAMGEVYKQMPVLPDSSPVTQYVQQLGKRLEKVIPAQNSWPYEFHVVQQKEINAFALPGGPIFVNVGTITAAANEAELAGVMAHEMSHIYMQHSAKQMKQNVGPSILAGVGQILGQMIGGVGGTLASIGGQMVGGMWSMRYSRADEAQADAVGAVIMYKGQYNPRAMAEFFEKLEKEAGPGGPQFLSDHPNPGNRVAAVDKEIANWPAQRWLTSSASFNKAHQDAQSVTAYSAQQIADGAKSGQWARQNQGQGSVPAGVSTTTPEATAAPAGNANIASVTYQQVKPSSTMKPIPGNPVFSIKYPNNWEAFQDQNGGITIAPAAGHSQGAVAYGVVFGGAKAQGGLQSVTQQIVQSLTQGNAGMRQTSGLEQIRVNGVPGMSADLSGPSPVLDSRGQPLPEHDWLVTLQRPDGSVLYAVFVAPERDYARLEPTFVNMVRTLRVR